MKRAELVVRIEGRVQGVGYRLFAQHEARRLGVKGYVRNLNDGAVEVVGQAPQNVTDVFLETLRRGPRMAEVTGIKTTARQATAVYTDFETRA